jgi:transketolase
MTPRVQTTPTKIPSPTQSPPPNHDKLSVDTVRTRAIDAVQNHPGTPMMMTPVAYASWPHLVRTIPPIPYRPLGRQALPIVDRSKYARANDLVRGNCILADAERDEPKVILIGSSSEAQLCVRRMKQCDAKGIGSRMVSMPSWGQFEKKQLTYRDDAVNASALAVGRNDTKLLS